jgi:hypothetical protein
VRLAAAAGTVLAGAPAAGAVAYNRPSTSERYRVADDLCQPIAAVVAVAEQEAITTPAGRQ